MTPTVREGAAGVPGEAGSWIGGAVTAAAAAAAAAAGFLSRGAGMYALSDFATVFFSILLEALPFVLLGTFVSSCIHILISPDTIARLFPRTRFGGLLIASLAGFAFPVCECANVPVTRRLLIKGMPTPVAITFLLAVAIVNPVVLFSTWVAFGGNMDVVLARGLTGMVIAVLVGWTIARLRIGARPLREYPPTAARTCDHGCGCGSETGEHEVDARAAPRRRRAAETILGIFVHTASELYSVGRFLILGAAVASFMQTILPRTALIGIGASPILSVLTLMILAFLLSLCSEADAFIAATFAAYFPPGAVVIFMVYGPMMDLKNTLMLLDGFKPRFVAALTALVTAACLAAGLLLNTILAGGTP